MKHMTYSEFRNQFPTVEQFRWAYGNLTEKKARALIEAEVCPTHIKACMYTAWRSARKEVLLENVAVHLHDDGGLSITFFEDDSEFDGNDFEYIYSLDADNTARFLDKISHGWADPKENIKDWLADNIRFDDFGESLQRKWRGMHLHGTHVVHEDYPGGIHRESRF